MSLPVDADPALSEEVKDLAREIAGPGASGEIQELGRRVAEAQIDLRRVRGARHQLFSDPTYDSAANRRQKWACLRRLLGNNAPETTLTDLVAFLETKPQGPEKFALILAEKAGRLLAMDRYERRARSRLRLAIRALDAARG